MPQLLELEGWEEQVELTEKPGCRASTFEIPEIEDKWPGGPDRRPRARDAGERGPG